MSRVIKITDQVIKSLLNEHSGLLNLHHLHCYRRCEWGFIKAGSGDKQASLKIKCALKSKNAVLKSKNCCSKVKKNCCSKIKKLLL